MCMYAEGEGPECFAAVSNYGDARQHHPVVYHKSRYHVTYAHHNVMFNALRRQNKYSHSLSSLSRPYFGAVRSDELVAIPITTNHS